MEVRETFSSTKGAAIMHSIDNNKCIMNISEEDFLYTIYLLAVDALTASALCR